MRPYRISAAFSRSVSRSTWPRSVSNSSLSVRIALIACFSASQCTFISLVCCCSSVSSSFKMRRRSVDAESDSFSNATRSISSCKIRRSITSISVGSESISILNLLAASSMRSIALSGKNRFVRYLFDNTAALTMALS